MRLNPFSRVWRADPVRIPLPTTAAATLAPLEEAVTRFALMAFGVDTCVGQVTDERVRLRHKRAFFHNDLSPVLDAVVTTDSQGRCLRGVYRTTWYGRIFLTFWFGALLLLAPFFMYAGVTTTVPGGMLMKLVFSLGPIGLIVVGSAMLIWGQRSWDDDKRFIEAYIAGRLTHSRTAVQPAHAAAEGALYRRQPPRS